MSRGKVEAGHGESAHAFQTPQPSHGLEGWKPSPPTGLSVGCVYSRHLADGAGEGAGEGPGTSAAPPSHTSRGQPHPGRRSVCHSRGGRASVSCLLRHLMVLRLPHPLLLPQKQLKDSADPWALQTAHTSPSLPSSLKQGDLQTRRKSGLTPIRSLCWWHLRVAGWLFSCRPWRGLARRTAAGKSPGSPRRSRKPACGAGTRQGPRREPEPPNRPRGPSHLHPAPHPAGRSGVCQRTRAWEKEP